MRDGEVGTRGIDIDRSDVDFDFRRNFFEKKRAMPFALKPSPALNFTGSQSE